MQEQIKQILEDAKTKVAAAVSAEEVEQLRVAFLGKKGQITEIFKTMGKLDKEKKKVIGPAANKLKNEVDGLINEKMAEMKQMAKRARFAMESIDVTEPGKAAVLGVKHPLTITAEQLIKIFTDMGYSIAEGPQVESVFNAFDALNSPANHPSRDLTDTFYITEDTVLRPHTSSVQIRCDTPDATHSPMFHQMEGLLVDEGITMADLKGTLDSMAKKLFGSDTKTKFRPHHFPFTEPSAEMDVSCFNCGGKGCRVCGGNGWIEILGCGVVHPNVLAVGGIDTEKYTGFAFGMGIERIAMLKYGVSDIRLFYENDVRFIHQFK